MQISLTPKQDLGLRWLTGNENTINWAPSSEFVSSSIPSWQVLTAHAQPFREARDLAFCLKVPLDSLLVWASSGGSGETARMRRLAWTFAARIGDKYQIRLTRSNWKQFISVMRWNHVIQFAINLSHLTSLKMYMYFINIMNKYSKLFNNGETIYEPPHDKNQKMSCAPSEDSGQPGHPLIWVFAGRTVILMVLSCCGSYWLYQFHIVETAPCETDPFKRPLI